MWTVLVEVHLPDGTGTLFQVGEWPRQNGASYFARDLEMMFGETKVTGHVVYTGNLLWRLWGKVMQGNVSVKQGIVLPPCDTLDFD